MYTYYETSTLFFGLYYANHSLGFLLDSLFSSVTMKNSTSWAPSPRRTAAGRGKQTRWSHLMDFHHHLVSCDPANSTPCESVELDPLPIATVHDGRFCEDDVNPCALREQQTTKNRPMIQYGNSICKIQSALFASGRRQYCKTTTCSAALWPHPKDLRQTLFLYQRLQHTKLTTSSATLPNSFQRLETPTNLFNSLLFVSNSLMPYKPANTDRVSD